MQKIIKGKTMPPQLSHHPTTSIPLPNLRDSGLKLWPFLIIKSPFPVKFQNKCMIKSTTGKRAKEKIQRAKLCPCQLKGMSCKFKDSTILSFLDPLRFLSSNCVNIPHLNIHYQDTFRVLCNTNRNLQSTRWRANIENKKLTLGPIRDIRWS